MSQLPMPAALLADLQQIEQVITDRANARPAVMQVAGHYISAASGQPIRAALALLTANLGQYDISTLMHAAAAAELIHAATSVHSDLVDDSEQRQGNKDTKNSWNDDIALMVGDYLLALASAEMALAPDPRIINIFSRSVMQIAEGKLQPVMDVHPSETAIAQYKQHVAITSAALIRASSVAGGMCGGLNDQQIAALERFGEQLGLAMQIAHDARDIAGENSETAGQSLRQGTIGLPLIYAVEASGTPSIADIIDLKDASAEQIANTCAQIIQHGGVDRARETADQTLKQAIQELNSFEDTPAKQTLIEFASYLVKR
jgi:heptaprenyl diphosphate synthase